MTDLGPRGSFNVHWFNLFNAISFQIIMGAPVILYTKSIGATSTVLGVLASFMPLMNAFQLPAAQLLGRYGYKQFILAGWGTRTIIVFFVSTMPLMAFLDDTSKLALLLGSLFLFNLLRGIASAAWMPWIAALIPEESRSRFLSIDQIFTYAGSLLALVISAIVLVGEHVSPGEYSLVFFVSAINATLSLVYVRKIPDVVAEETVRRSSQSVPWKAILSYPPFRELLIFNLTFVMVTGSLSVFTIEYLREFPGFNSSLILFLSGISFFGALVSLPFIGRLMENTGSKLVLSIALGIFGIVLAGWFCIAAGILPHSIFIIGALSFFVGVAGANLNLANVRIAMATMPELGRNHFYALFTVISNLGLGIAPVIWGLLLDFFGTYELVTGTIHWKRHSIYFALLFLLNLAAITLVRRLHEARGSLSPSLIYARLRRHGKLWWQR